MNKSKQTKLNALKVKQADQIETIGTWLPIFTGYYHSIFDESESFIDSETSMCEDEYKEYYSELYKAGVTHEYFISNLWNHCNFNSCFLEASKSICYAITDLEHLDIITNIEFDKLVSPKYYNFSTDSINCDISYNVNKLQKYIDSNLESYAEYIGENYTSKDGFSSWHSNDVDDWKDMSDLGSHSLGSVLQFVLQQANDDPILDLYYAANLSECFFGQVEIDYKSFIEAFNENEVA